MNTEYKCPWCGKTGVIIDGVDDCSIDISCPHCEEAGRFEPDGLGEGGLEWAEAMAYFEGGF